MENNLYYIIAINSGFNEFLKGYELYDSSNHWRSTSTKSSDHAIKFYNLDLARAIAKTFGGSLVKVYEKESVSSFL